ncbi:hypothetical protein J0695_32660, partial [Streptomyces beijiangensis]|nr:hypothetical protein [Streptomyces beijiangensis]
SWDAELVGRVGEALGRESRHHGVGVLLGPGINIKRDPRCGRNFEYYSEDPHLAGGKQVAGTLAARPRWSVAPACLRTPCGPSVSSTDCAGPTALVVQKSAPLPSAAFSSTERPVRSAALMGCDMFCSCVTA